MGKKQKFYAIKVGKDAPCIVTNWNECSSRVTGFPGAKYKSFVTKGDAEAFLADEVKSVTTCCDVIYVDGSYCEETNSFGGAYLHLRNDELVSSYRSESVCNNFSQFRNVSGEVLAVIAAVDYCLRNGITEVDIVFDYEGIRSWALGDWKAESEIAKFYRNFVTEISNHISINFVKVKGHSGERWNEAVDELAKKASGVLPS